MSVRPSAWNNSAPTGRIFMKFDIDCFSKICRENSSFITISQQQQQQQQQQPALHMQTDKQQQQQQQKPALHMQTDIQL